MTRVQVYLDPKHIDILDLLASQAGTSRSQAIREAVEVVGKRVKRVKKSGKNPLLKMAGAAGHVPSRKDLARNVDEIYLH